MEVRPITDRLFRGRSTPAMRAIVRLLPRSLSALPLLVLRVLADHPNHSLALDDLALCAESSNRRTNFHKRFLSIPFSFIYSDRRCAPATGHKGTTPRLPCLLAGCG